jgi:hypothetical protein
VLAQPSGFRPELPDLSYQNNMKGWGPALCARRPDITMEMVHNFLTNMYTKRADFVYTVTCCGLIEMDTLIRVLGSSEEVSDDHRQPPYLYRGMHT